MHHSQIAQIQKLQRHGYSPREIAALTGFAREEVSGVFDNQADLRRLGLRMLRQMPTWWRGTKAEYTKCVRANFADVL